VTQKIIAMWHQGWKVRDIADRLECDIADVQAAVALIGGEPKLPVEIDEIPDYIHTTLNEDD
jgi:hypothetical protein